MGLSVPVKISKYLSFALFSIVFLINSIEARSENIDFSIIIKDEDGKKRTLNNNEVIPLENEIQLKFIQNKRGL